MQYLLIKIFSQRAEFEDWGWWYSEKKKSLIAIESGSYPWFYYLYTSCMTFSMPTKLCGCEVLFSPFKRNLEMTSCVSYTWKCYTISYLCFAAFKRGYFHGCYSVFGTSDLKCSNKNMRTCATKVKNWQEKIYSLNWERWKWVELRHIKS